RTMRIRATAAMATVLLCAASLGSAQTAPPPGQFVDYGAGPESCGSWLAARQATGTSLWLQSGQWVLGWVSAAGASNVPAALRTTDSEAIAAWVDKYCREHPLDNLAAAAKHLVDELSKPN